MTGSTTPASATASRTSGFTIVEVMVALTIGLIILAAISMIFVNTKIAYESQNRLARIQENGRFAMHFLLQDIRHTGFLGCRTGPADPSRINNMLDPGNGGAGFSFTLTVPVEGLDGDSGMATWAPSGDNQRPANWVAGTDMIAIRTVDPTSIRYLTTPISNARTDPLLVNDAGVFNVSDIIAVTDCNRLDLMQVTGVQLAPPTIFHATAGGFTPGNITNVMSASYGTPDQDLFTLRAVKVFRYTTRRYYIGLNLDNVPSLFVDTNGTQQTELVEGIENLQILYGVDTDGTTPGTSGDDIPNVYLQANAVANWDRIVSVRIGVLARTIGEVDTTIAVEPRTYDVNGLMVTLPAAPVLANQPGDRFQRRVFLSTVQLREISLR